MSATTPHHPDLHVDVAIVGGGMVGAALAALLGEHDIQVAVVDAQLPAEFDPQKIAPRVSALTRASEALLTHLQVWPAMAARRVSPFTGMQVWDRDGTGSIGFSAQELGESHLGHMVENAVIQQSLWESLEQYASVHRFCPDRIQQLHADPIDGHRLRLNSGVTLQASLLVGADGARSWLREQFDFITRQWSYQQTAIVTTVKSELDHDRIARQVFLSSGPLAHLPLIGQQQENLGSIVWSCDAERYEALMALSEADFAKELAFEFEQSLGAFELVDQRYHFPLIQRHAVSYVQPGVALVGDAAHSIHPLAGQGVNMGLLDAAVLAQELAKGFQYGVSLADPALLRRYERRRKGHNLLMMSTMEGFKRLFSADPLPLRWLRNTGLRLTDRAGPVKQQILAHAMGLAGDLPETARVQPENLPF